MKNFLFFFFLVCGFQLSAQDSTEVHIHRSTLKVGQGFSFGNGAIKFKEVISDSRCPREVTCVWAGEAKILVEFYEAGKLVSEKILTTGANNIPLNISAEGVLYHINGLVLEPYPSVKTKEEVPVYTLNVTIQEQLLKS